MANDWKYGRSGWNRRGPTDLELLQAAREESDPDSYLWQNKTNNLRLALIEAMGEFDFCQYAESVFPGSTIEQYTWKQIHDTYLAKLERLADDRLQAKLQKICTGFKQDCST